MDINDFIKKQIEFDKNYKGKREFFTLIDDSNIEELEYLVVCLSGEVGEFANIVKKISRGDFLLSECKENISMELADIFIYLLKIFAQLKINPEDIFLSKMEINREKFLKYRRNKL